MSFIDYSDENQIIKEMNKEMKKEKRKKKKKIFQLNN